MRHLSYRYRIGTGLSLLIASYPLYAGIAKKNLIHCDSRRSYTTVYHGTWRSYPHPFFDDSGAWCDVKGPCGKTITTLTPGTSAVLCGYALHASEAEMYGKFDWRYTITILASDS